MLVSFEVYFGPLCVNVGNVGGCGPMGGAMSYANAFLCAALTFFHVAFSFHLSSASLGMIKFKYCYMSSGGLGGGGCGRGER